MKCKFWLLDLNESIWNGRPCVQLWGISERNERVIIVAPEIVPYFYFLPAGDVDSTLKAILADGMHFPKIAGGSMEQRKLLGREKTVLKISCTESGSVSAYAKQLPKFGGSSFDDLGLTTRYVTDLRLVICGWNECEVEPLRTNHAMGGQGYMAATSPKPIGADSPPRLRLLAFAQLAIGKRGSAKPERDPIRGLAIAVSNGKRTIFHSSGEDDSEVLSSFVAAAKEFDPDVIVGHETTKSHWSYLLERGKVNKFELALGRDGSEPHTSRFGHVSITGRVNLDLSDLAAGIMEVKVKDLKNLSRHFNLPDADGLTGRDEWERAALWENELTRLQLLNETQEAAKACLQLAEATINYPMQLSTVTGMPLDQILAAAVGFRVDSYIARIASSVSELIPRKNEQSFLTYRGALVKEPKTGLHENIAVLDFASMYPSLMKKYNLSPDTLVRADEDLPPDSVYLIPEVGHRFRKKPYGFYSIALTGLIEERARIKRELSSITADLTRAQLLRDREKAVKVIANACYGYAGWAGARWYVREVAESAAALGRQLITETIDKAKSLGLDVIYSDTDSIFVSNVKPKVQELIDWVSADQDLEIKVDYEYVRVLFTEAMKRYAGLRRDETLDIVGLEVVRGDWSEIAREVQEKVLFAILKLQSTEAAIEAVRETVRRMKNGELPMEVFTIRKSLTRPIEKYRVRTPHVEVARKLAKEDWGVTVGDKVAYVIAKGKGALFQKARPLHYVGVGDLDLDYYLENQVKPAAMRILETFGVTDGQVGL